MKKDLKEYKTFQNSSRATEASLNGSNGSKNSQPKKKEDSKTRKRREAEARQALSKKRKDKKETINKLESNITKLESRQAEINSLLEKSETYAAGGNASVLNRELMTINDDLEKFNKEWSEVVDALNAIN